MFQSHLQVKPTNRKQIIDVLHPKSSLGHGNGEHVGTQGSHFVISWDLTEQALYPHVARIWLNAFFGGDLGGENMWKNKSSNMCKFTIRIKQIHGIIDFSKNLIDHKSDGFANETGQ